jgi:hypothetical protein
VKIVLPVRMMSAIRPDSASEPGMARIAAALRATTETLAAELAEPRRAAPAWTQFEWRIAQAAAALHGISALLDARLPWRGPEPWQRFLEGQRRHACARHVKIRGLLESIDHEARAAGVPLVALKGAALYAGGVYAPGMRPMGDIDLLVRPHEARAAGRILQRCGYAPGFTSRRHAVYHPRAAGGVPPGRLGEHIDNPIKIEVHTRIAEALPVGAVDISPDIFPACRRAGLNGYPSDVVLLRHLLLHAAGNMRARALRHVQLHDIALLVRRLPPADLETLAARREDSWLALPPLLLAARYHPGAIPAPLIGACADACPWLLRRAATNAALTDVSWSQIRIEAFPGIEWSRSLGEACRFMRSRIAPSRDALRELRDGAEQIPGVDSVPWYGLSHATRAVRWLISTPPRVQTMLSVRAALGEPARD